MNDVHIEKKVRIRPRWWWIVVGAVVAGGGGFLAIGTGHGNESEKKSTDDGILAVNLVQPKVQSFRREIYQPGIVQSYEQTPIYSKLAGFVQIPDDKIDIGYMVKKDQLLCKIWVPEIEQAVHVKEARVIQGTAERHSNGACIQCGRRLRDHLRRERQSRQGQRGPGQGEPEALGGRLHPV